MMLNQEDTLCLSEDMLEQSRQLIMQDYLYSIYMMVKQVSLVATTALNSTHLTMFAKTSSLGWLGVNRSTIKFVKEWSFHCVFRLSK